MRKIYKNQVFQIQLKRAIWVWLIIFGVFLEMSLAQIPSSTLSKEAISRVKPQLEKDFNDAGLEFGSDIFIRIFKHEEELEIWVEKEEKFELFRTYEICTFGGAGLGPKTKQGDGKAPEGFYFVTPSQLNPYSSYHLSFNLGYPNKYDRLHNRTGSALMVHGDCVSIGCFAMTDEKIEEIYAIADSAFRKGQAFFRVHIFPFRMNEKNMKRSKRHDFWDNLKEGYDFFEKEKIPPNVDVKNEKYIFEKIDKN